MVHQAIVCAEHQVVSNFVLAETSADPEPMSTHLTPPPPPPPAGMTRDHFESHQLLISNPDVSALLKQSSHTSRVAKLVHTTPSTPRMNVFKCRPSKAFPAFSIRGPAPSLAHAEPLPTHRSPFMGQGDRLQCSGESQVPSLACMPVHLSEALCLLGLPCPMQAAQASLPHQVPSFDEQEPPCFLCSLDKHGLGAYSGRNYRRIRQYGIKRAV